MRIKREIEHLNYIKLLMYWTKMKWKRKEKKTHTTKLYNFSVINNAYPFMNLTKKKYEKKIEQTFY